MSEHAAAEAVPTLDLSACEREAIHLIPHVQPHGVLLALDPQTFAVLQVSESIEALFGVSPARMLQEGLGALLDAASMVRLRERMMSEPLERTPVHLLLAIDGRGPYDILGHRHQGVLILEIEPFAPSGRRPPDFYPILRRSLPRLRESPTLRAFCQGVTEEIRAISGFDRVMIYRFLADGSGEVIAEARAEEMPPYLGLRYPASDLPKQARAMYLQTPVRAIVDAAYTPSPLVPALDPRTNKPLDLSYSHLRGVSATHVEYLANMGVRGSMSVAILRGEELWGLIACHHRTRWGLPYEARSACEFVATMVSSQVVEKETRDMAEARARMDEACAALAQRIAGLSMLLPAIAEGEPSPASLVPCGGAAVISDGLCQRFGATPPEPEIRALLGALLARHAGEEVIATDELAAIYPPAASLMDTAAGVLAIPVDAQGEQCLLWFRPEVVRTVNWAGDPRRPAETSADGQRVNPRRSFELWKEISRGRSEPFDPAEIEVAKRLRSSLTSLVFRRNAELAAVNAELARRVAELERLVRAAGPGVSSSPGTADPDPRGS